MSFYEKSRFLQEYLDLKGFTCYPKEFEIKINGEESRFADFAAYKDGDFWAFEYKSFGDWVGRGLEQCKLYAKWFNYVVLVVERNLTRKSRFFKEISENGFGLLLRGIDGKLIWKLDPKKQKPSVNNQKYVLKKFKSVPFFRKFICEETFGPVPPSVYQKFQEMQAEQVNSLMNGIKKEMLNYYISVCSVGTLLEPQLRTLITYSLKPFNVKENIDTAELEKWLENPEIVYILDYVDYDKRWDGIKEYVKNQPITVGEVLSKNDRVFFMAYNIARDLIYCRNNPKSYCKEQVIKQVLKDLRKKKI